MSCCTPRSTRSSSVTSGSPTTTESRLSLLARGREEPISRAFALIPSTSSVLPLRLVSRSWSLISVTQTESDTKSKQMTAKPMIRLMTTTPHPKVLPSIALLEEREPTDSLAFAGASVDPISSSLTIRARKTSASGTYQVKTSKKTRKRTLKSLRIQRWPLLSL